MVPKNRKITSVLTETFNDFFHSSTSGGIVLLLCTGLALLWANSPWSEYYFQLWEQSLSFGFGTILLSNTLLHWVNDGIMVIFFLFVGLEIKREILVGELSTLKKALLPIIAAFGGMIGPALIYIAFNSSETGTLHGWGIPMATDIAFALGILALLGKRVPPGLKIFLAALAIADDMGAVLVIALFYTSELSFSMLGAAGGFMLLLLIANKYNVRSTTVFTILGIGLWFCFLHSGIHATIAGVLLALTIPVRSQIDKQQFIGKVSTAINELKDDQSSKMENELIHHVASLSEKVQSPLHRFEHALHPLVSFFIMPVFAFANAGVRVEGSIVDALFSPVGLGIVLGLVVGKQIGIMSFVWIAVTFNIASLPHNVSWRMIYGATWLCAIGFTMALFIAGLAFDSTEPLIISKIAILFASTLSAIVGLLLLRSMPVLRDDL